MNIKHFRAVALCLIVISCSSTVETEFGKSCSVNDFKYEKKSFSSDITGAVKFQMDESAAKDSGKVITGTLPQITQGSFPLTLSGGMSENCSDCILMFIRDKVKGDRGYKAVSGNMNVESLYYDSKGRVTFAKGHFSRMVFENIDEESCVVVARIDFIFY